MSYTWSECNYSVSVWAKAHYQLMILTSISRNGGLTVLLLYVHVFRVLQDKTTALMCAAKGGHIDVAQALLSQQNMDINMTDEVTIYCTCHSMFM